MSGFRRNKKYTETEKQEIIAYAQEHGTWTVKERFNVWPENVRYWLASIKVKQEISEKGKERHQKTKLDTEVQQRNKEYREYRKSQGITPKKWKEWYEGLTAEARVKLNENVKQHRHDNMDISFNLSNRVVLGTSTAISHFNKSTTTKKEVLLKYQR
jgi:hypothetical protein